MGTTSVALTNLAGGTFKLDYQISLERTTSSKTAITTYIYVNDTVQPNISTCQSTL